jgi:hypothetical protein
MSMADPSILRDMMLKAEMRKIEEDPSHVIG